MNKLPARYHRFALPLVLTFFMTCIIAGLSTFTALGFVAGAFTSWMKAWMLSWATAFPIMLFVLPATRRLVNRVVHER